jgi:predicted CDP-diglyceride synthetase/phosphatidate cytidylyltransferase
MYQSTECSIPEASILVRTLYSYLVFGAARNYCRLMITKFSDPFPCIISVSTILIALNYSEITLEIFSVSITITPLANKIIFLSQTVLVS